MADESQIKTEDFLPKDLLQAPLILTKNIETLLGRINSLTNDTLKLSSAIKDEKASLTDINKATQQLAKSETDLINYQKQVVDLVQKETAVRSLQDQEIKKLQQNYAKLNTEAQRGSVEGKKTLDALQKQNSELKKAERAAIDAANAQEKLGDQFSALDKVTGGWIGNLKQLGNSFVTLAKNPFFIAVAALVGLFSAAKSAADAYYTATIEGEKALADSEATNKAFFDAYRDSWLNLGKTVSDLWQGIKNEFMSYVRLVQSDDTTRQQIKNAYELSLIENERFSLRNEHLRDEVDDAGTLLKVTELLEKAKDKEEYSAKQRLEAQLEGGKLLADQEEGDLELAKRDLQLQKDIIQYESNANKGRYDQTRSILELSDKEIDAIKVKAEDIKKLADLETAYIKIQSDAAAKRVARLKLELSLRKEVIQEDIQERARLTEKAFDQYNEKNPNSPLDNLKKFADDQVNLEIQTADKSIEITKKSIDEKLSFWRKYGKAIGEDIKLEEIDNFLGQALSTYNDFYSALTNLSNTFTQNELQNIQTQQNALQEAKTRELNIAGDNAAAKTVIEQKYTAKEKELKREQAQATAKQAQFNKITALIEAGIKEAQLIIESLLFPTPGRIAAAIAGGIQVGAIAAKQIPPVPAYAKGTPATPRSEWALTGEEGAELVEKPGQKPILTPAQPTMMFLPKGTKVSTHAETVKRLANIGLNVDRSPQGQDLQELRRAIDKQTNVIENKPFVNVSLTEGAVRLEIQRAARKDRRLGSLYS